MTFAHEFEAPLSGVANARTRGPERNRPVRAHCGPGREWCHRLDPLKVPGGSVRSVSSGAQLCPTLCDLMDCSTPGLPVHHHPRSSLKLMSIESVMPSNRLILCCPLLLLPSVFPSIRVFSSESVLPIRWPKDWSFSFNISPSNKHSRLISFGIEWLDLLAVQGTLKSLLQDHSSKASILGRSAFFKAQLSHGYITTGKTIAFIRWTFVSRIKPINLKGNQQ